jgi:hypothetical protein
MYCFLFIIFVVCMYLCATIDDTRFEGPQEPNFEDFSEQQQFVNEGKCFLDHSFVLINHNKYKFFFICMHVS